MMDSPDSTTDPLSETILMNSDDFGSHEQTVESICNNTHSKILLPKSSIQDINRVENSDEKFLDTVESLKSVGENDNRSRISLPENQFLESGNSSSAVHNMYKYSQPDIHMCSCEAEAYGDISHGLDIRFFQSMTEGDMTLLDNEIYSKSCEDIYIMKNSLEIGPSTSRSLSEELLPTCLERKHRFYVHIKKGKLVGCPSILLGERRNRFHSTCRPLPSQAIIPKKESKLPSVQPIPPQVKKTKFNREQKFVILCLCLVDFTSFLSMSIIAPFFPKEAAKKGMREAVSGGVFSVYALIVMLLSPLFGKLIPIFGTKFLFLSGVFFSGGCNVLFGFLNQISDDLTFAVFCFVVRAFEALGAAAFTTASCTIIIDMFPDDIGTVFGFTETCIGIGMSLGPAIGGFLYSAGGFFLPFCTLGVFTILIVPVCWYLLKPIENITFESKVSISYTKLLSLPHVLVLCIIVMVSSQAQGFLDPTLEPHMRKFNIEPATVGLLFLLLSAAYAIFSPIIGWLAGKMDNTYPIMVLGLLIMTVSLLLIGPAPFIPINGSFWLSTVTLVVIGATFAMAFIPTFESILDAALSGGFEDDLGTYSVVAGLWNSVYSLGEVTGPALGGVLADVLNFPYAASIMAVCSTLACSIALVAWINPLNCFGPLTEAEASNVDDNANKSDNLSKKCVTYNDHTPLLSSASATYGSC